MARHLLAALGALLLCTAAWSQELQGYWMSAAGPDPLVLHVDAQRVAHAKAARGGRWQSIAASELQLDGKGQLVRNGVSYARSTLADIHQWVAENPLPAARARKGSEIELLYVGAADCGFCRRWEAKYLDGPKPRDSAGWKDVRFTPVDIGSFRVHFGAADVPARLKAAVAKMLEADGTRLLRGTPWFAVLVNGEVRAHGFGTNTFETLIQPSIRAALREKAA